MRACWQRNGCSIWSVCWRRPAHGPDVGNLETLQRAYRKPPAGAGRAGAGQRCRPGRRFQPVPSAPNVIRYLKCSAVNGQTRLYTNGAKERAHPTVVYEPSAEALRSKYPGSVGEFAEAVVLLGQLNDQYRLQRTDAVQEDSRI